MLGVLLGCSWHSINTSSRSGCNRTSLLTARRAASTYPTDQRTPISAVSSQGINTCFAQSAMRDFYGCYLLTSLDPKNKGRTYIGSVVATTLAPSLKVAVYVTCRDNHHCNCSFTVNPRRRIRQHNGEITAGAHRTKRCCLTCYADCPYAITAVHCCAFCVQSHTPGACPAEAGHGTWCWWYMAFIPRYAYGQS